MRAQECYRVAASLSEEGSFVALSAKGGEIILRIGVHARYGPLSPEAAAVPAVELKEAMIVANACRSMGGTLEAVGAVIEALVTSEILKAK